MNLNKSHLIKQTIALLLIVAMAIPMFASVSACCDKSEKYSCSEKSSDSFQVKKNCAFCDFQFSTLNFQTPKAINFFIFKKLIATNHKTTESQYSSFYFLNRQLRAPPVYS